MVSRVVLKPLACTANWSLDLEHLRVGWRPAMDVCQHVEAWPETRQVPSAQLTSALRVQVCLNVLRAGLIASRVDVTLELYPGVVLAPLVIGTIAGSGGKLISDGVAMASGHLTGVPQCRSVPP